MPEMAQEVPSLNLEEGHTYLEISKTLVLPDAFKFGESYHLLLICDPSD